MGNCIRGFNFVIEVFLKAFYNSFQDNKTFFFEHKIVAIPPRAKSYLALRLYHTYKLHFEILYDHKVIFGLTQKTYLRSKLDPALSTDL